MRETGLQSFVTSHPPRHRASRVLMLALLAFSLVTPGDASAQEGGVFIDPDSPGGKEYALPADQARRDFARDRDDPERVSSLDPQAGPAPLFGGGISGEARERSRRGTRGNGSDARGPASAGTAAQEKLVDAVVERIGASPDDEWASWLALVGVALGLLAAGVLGGIALRRRAGRRG